MSFGISEIILILIAIVLLFDLRRLPELARVFGKIVQQYRKAKETIKKEAHELTRDFTEKPIEYQLKDDIENPQV